MKDPQSLIDKLTSEPFKFKLKGTGPISFQLGMDITNNNNNNAMINLVRDCL
jgi:hypothetical protein